MTTYVPVAGTFDWDPVATEPHWWQPGSDFEQFMRARDFAPRARTWPFWSTTPAGALIVGRAQRAWKHGAHVLADYLEDVADDDRNLIGFSHGGQVAAIAAAKHVNCARLVTVGTPVRKDLAEIYASVDCPWLHLYSTGWENRWQFFGSLFDRGVRLRWAMPAPATNHRVEGTAHGGLLRRASEFASVWDETIVPFLRGGAA